MGGEGRVADRRPRWLASRVQAEQSSIGCASRWEPLEIHKQSHNVVRCIVWKITGSAEKVKLKRRT